jgi:hypothetical protein
VEQSVEWQLAAKRKPASLPLRPPQIPRDVTWARTLAAGVGSRTNRLSYGTASHIITLLSGRMFHYHTKQWTKLRLPASFMQNVNDFPSGSLLTRQEHPAHNSDASKRSLVQQNTHINTASHLTYSFGPKSFTFPVPFPTQADLCFMISGKSVLLLKAGDVSPLIILYGDKFTEGKVLRAYQIPASI